jgi:hypothetical protein
MSSFVQSLKEIKRSGDCWSYNWALFCMKSDIGMSNALILILLWMWCYLGSWKNVLKMISLFTSHLAFLLADSLTWHYSVSWKNGMKIIGLLTWHLVFLLADSLTLDGRLLPSVVGHGHLSWHLKRLQLRTCFYSWNTIVTCPWSGRDCMLLPFAG